MTQEEGRAEYLKCATDPVYFLNNYGYVFDAKTKSVQRMKCFEYQEDCVYNFHKHRNNIVLKSRQCLPWGTLIDTPSGKVAIQDFRVGDKLYSFNLKQNKVEVDTIKHAWCSGDRQCVKIFLENGEIVESGENHPFYLHTKTFVKAKDIKSGDKILNVNSGYIGVKRVEETKVRVCFDISVEENENFLINGLLAHNTGLSVITAGYVAWRLMFRKNEKILIIANDGDGAVRFLKHVKQYIYHTPEWLRPGEKGDTGIDNQKFISLKNGSYAQAKASSEQAGRGDSLTLLVLDETAFIDNADSIWMAAGMALSVTRGKCIMISTPKGSGNLYHNTWVAAEQREGEFQEDDFVATRVHWIQNPYCAEGLELREDESGEKFYWSPWYEGECKRMLYDSIKIAQELDLSFEGSKHLAIENELISKYEKRLFLDEYKLVEKEKSYYDYKNKSGERFVNYETSFQVFKKYIPGHKYMVGADVARGDGSDYSTIEVIDIDTLEVVAEYEAKISPDLFAHVIYNVSVDYGEAYAVVECNSFGLATAIDLNRKMNYDRMYFSKNIQEIYVRPYDYKVQENEIIPGFQTTKRTRPLIINNLRTHMREGALKVYSKKLLSQLRTFVQKGDRPEAEKGKNDDLIFALAIVLFIRDTEYQTAAATKEMYKGMLEGIGCVSKSIVGQEHNSNPTSGSTISEIPPGAGGIFFNDLSKDRASVIDDRDDISWLLGPILKRLDN